MAGIKIPPSEKIRKEIGEMVAGEGEAAEGGNLVEWLMEKAKGLIVQELLEREVEEFLGRKHYQRKKEDAGQAGYRNGYEPRRLKTAEGLLTMQVPQVRDTEEKFCSRLKEFFRNNTEVLEKLAAEMYTRGLSSRDIEEALHSATGDRLLSRSSVSRVTEILWEEYQAFCRRDLSVYEVEYLVIDAVYETIRRYVSGNEAILVAFGICRDGRKVLLHMELGNKESYDFCRGFLRNMVQRGLNIPLSVTSDGAPGMVKAIDEVFGRSLRIRCWVHKMTNLSNKVPKEDWVRIKPEIAAIRDSVDYQEGERRLKEFVGKYQRVCPSLVACLLDDWQALLNVLYLPARHRKNVRTTNLVERSFVEERRRTKIIPQFLTERSCLKLVFSVLYRSSFRWRRIPMSAWERAEIDRLRKVRNIPVPEQKSAVPEKEAVLVS